LVLLPNEVSVRASIDSASRAAVRPTIDVMR
jgi:hypothetical protein